MQAARGTFGAWHAVSLCLNLAAIVCVTAATVLAADLPAEPRPVGRETACEPDIK
jgi:hypothetical protein